MPDIFVFDIDGTLFAPGNNTIDPDSLRALNLVSPHGEIILASARPLRGILNLNCGFPNHIIALNGALTLSDKVIRSNNPIAKEITSILLQSAHLYRNIWFYTQSEWYCTNFSTAEYQKEKNAVSHDALPIEKYKGEEILKITLVDSSSREEICSLLSSFEGIMCASSNPSYIEIYSSSTNKFDAIGYLTSLSGKRIFSFCDSDNDLPLVRNSFYSCAPVNASQKVKDCALYISDFKYGKGTLDSVIHIYNLFLFRSQ